MGRATKPPAYLQGRWTSSWPIAERQRRQTAAARFIARVHACRKALRDLSLSSLHSGHGPNGGPLQGVMEVRRGGCDGCTCGYCPPRLPTDGSRIAARVHTFASNHDRGTRVLFAPLPHCARVEDLKLRGLLTDWTLFLFHVIRSCAMQHYLAPRLLLHAEPS